jgi:TRAP-type C4-dicarboxylate transport system substrate-binding protein
MINAYTAFQPFKLDEVTHHHVDNVPFGANTGAVFMAKKKYQSLPEAARKVIDANRGEKESRTFGAFWDAVQEEGHQYTKEKPNHTFLVLTPDQTANWRRQAEAVLAEWSKSVPDGERILATFRELLAKVMSEG